MSNPLLRTDSYKVTHWNQYPNGTEGVYSYLESREGAKWPYTVFFGLQSILYTIQGSFFDQYDIEEAETIAEFHFGDKDHFNRAGWEYILNEYKGFLPLRVKAVPEGSKIPTSNVLMTVEITDPKCFWLTNWIESLLTPRPPAFA